MAYELPELKYAYDALEPSIDAKTMEIHHTKHHQAYITKVNAAIEGTQFEDLSIEELCNKINELPENIKGAVRNNGGGHANHSLFWDILSSNESSPSDELQSAIDAYLVTWMGLRKHLVMCSSFGSGWAWLCKNSDSSLSGLNLIKIIHICQMLMGANDFCLDVWEHAYYLNYQTDVLIILMPF